MYTLTVRHHAFVAHSLKHDMFGPARNLHGVTYLVEAEFRAPRLGEANTVLDVVEAERVLKDALEPYGYRNLDEIPELAGQLTTMEFMARRIHEGIAALVAGRFSGGLKVTLTESPQASAAYEAEVAPRPARGVGA